MHKRHFLIIASLWVLTCFGLFVAPSALVFAVDPLRVLREYEGDDVYFGADSRYMFAGIIHHHLLYKKDKQNIILGSSVMRDTLPVDLEKFAHIPNALPIGIDALQADELATILGLAAQADQVENIVISFDSFRYFFPDAMSNWGFPFDLYTGSYWQRFKASISMQQVKLALDILRGKALIVDPTLGFPVMPPACQADTFSKYHAQFALKKAVYDDFIPQQSSEPVDISGFIDLHKALAAIKAMPEHIHMHLLLPPTFAGGMELVPPYHYYKSGVLKLVEEVAQLPNVTVYGFDDMYELTNNMANFWNDNHYGVGVNRYMLKAIGAQRHIITPQNVEQYLQTVWENRTVRPVFLDAESTISFEGPVDEKLFSQTPLPYGPHPTNIAP